MKAVTLRPAGRNTLLQAVIQASPLAIVALDTDANITMWSPAAERLFGWTEHEVLGRPDPLVPVEKQEEFRALREVVLRGATLTGAELCRRRKDGSHIRLLVSAAPLRDAKGTVNGMVAVITDNARNGQTQDSLVRSLEQERYITDLFQRSFSPASETTFTNLEVATLCEPALAETNVGGDFCDAFALNAGKIALLVGDVCGKGLQAAIYTGQLMHAVRAYLRESPYPTQALARLNRFVCDTQRLDGRGEDTFTVMALAVVDPASGDTVLSIAGAEPPLLLRSSGEMEAIAPIGNLPLGVAPGEAYTAAEMRLEQGDTLLLATDGITEARRGSAFLGYEGMVALAEDAIGLQSLRECAEAILQGARTFADGLLHDDACLLLARRT